jgi:YHS domain-containing protein
VLPIVLAYRKYYGWPFTVRIVALMFVTMVVAALAVDAAFDALGLIPGGARPSRGEVFGSLAVDYKLVLNLLGLAIFTALFWMTRRRGARDPVCGMRVDRAKALRLQDGGETLYFCSEHCLQAFGRQGGEGERASAAGARPRPRTS